jgi:hypothetical protein
MIRSRLKHAVDWRLRGVIDRLDALAGRVEALTGRVEQLHGRLDRADGRLAELNAAVGALDPLGQLANDASATRAVVEQRLQPAVRAILDEEADNRRRLFSMRESAAYASAYEESDPLVSVTVPTVGRSLRCWPRRMTISRCSSSVTRRRRSSGTRSRRSGTAAFASGVSASG